MDRVLIQKDVPERKDLLGYSDMVKYIPRDGRMYYFPVVYVETDNPFHTHEYDAKRVIRISEVKG